MSRWVRKRCERQNRRCEQTLQIAFDIVKIHVEGFARPLLRQSRTIRQAREFQGLGNIRHCGFGCLHARITVKHLGNFKHPHAGLRACQIGFQIVHQGSDQLRAHHRKTAGDGVEQLNRIHIHRAKIFFQCTIDETVINDLLIIHRHQRIAHRIRRAGFLGHIEDGNLRHRRVGRDVVVAKQTHDFLNQIFFNRHVKAIRRRLYVQHTVLSRAHLLHIQLQTRQIRHHLFYRNIDTNHLAGTRHTHGDVFTLGQLTYHFTHRADL